MLKVAAQKLVGGQTRTFYPVLIPVAYAHIPIGTPSHTSITDGHPVQVSAQISDGLLRPQVQVFAKHHPCFFAGNLRDHLLWQRGFDLGKELGTENFGQRFYRNQILTARKKHGAAIAAKPHCWNQQVNVRMIEHGAAPGMQDGQNPNQLRPEVAVIGRKLHHARSRRFKKDRIGDFLVGSHQRSELGRQGEHQVEVWHGH